VPKSLLAVSTHLTFANNLTPRLWLQWAEAGGAGGLGPTKSQLTATAATKTSSTVTANALVDENNPPNIDVDDGFTATCEEAKEVLRELESFGADRDLDVPLDYASEPVRQKVHELFAEKKTKTGIVDVEQLPFGPEARQSVIDRMGPCLVGVKRLFDAKVKSKGKGSNLAADDAASLLLDLFLSEEIFAKARAWLSLKRLSRVDFASFLQLYSQYCNLRAPASSAAAEREQYWVPNRSGQWKEAPSTTSLLVQRAASPYALDNEEQPVTVFLLEASGDEVSVHPRRKDHIWVKSSDLADILMLAGLVLDERLVQERVLAVMKPFIPGVESGRISLQELLVIYTACCDEKDSLQPQAASHGSSVESSSKEMKISTRWRLPFKGHVTTRPSAKAITEEFRRLDIVGEGRLTFLGLKSALMLREAPEDDATIRSWLREHDRKGKGFVDLDDYRSIYAEVSDEPPVNVLATKKGQGEKKEKDNERESLLRLTFERYDVDGDGIITVSDLRKAFEQQRVTFSEEDLQAWISARVLSAHESVKGVSFVDFSAHYR
jgi:Ca2+-binding EF-hand superfamily protein